MGPELTGAIIGGAISIFTGIVLFTLGPLGKWIRFMNDKKKVYSAIEKLGGSHVRTRKLANMANMTEERVEYICHRHPKISTGMEFLEHREGQNPKYVPTWRLRD